MKRFVAITFVCLLLILTTLVATAQDDLETAKSDFIATYAEIVYVSYTDSLTLATELQEAITTFLENPTEETLETAKEAWLAAQEPYGQTEVYRFYGGPIDDEDGPEALINAWPLDEAYIDYVAGDPNAGVINNPEDYPEITADLLVEINEMGSEENIATGYHAIEFLLWGQDLSADGPGNRPYTDYTTAENADRRAEYLHLAADLLVQHLTEVTTEWDPEGESNYRADFLALEPEAALQNILTGMGVLAKSELAGERMFTAYDNQDQEDEHSCFSDNTHRDIITNFMGIQNVYYGSYVRLGGTEISGTGLDAVVSQIDPTLAEELSTLLATANEQVNAISVPFDQAIIEPESRPVVLDAVFTLQDLGNLVADAAIALNIAINTALPE